MSGTGTPIGSSAAYRNSPLPSHHSNSSSSSSHANGSMMAQHPYGNASIGSRPSSAASGSAAQPFASPSSSNLRSVSPFMSRRTWQLQADEGLTTAAYKASSQLGTSGQTFSANDRASAEEAFNASAIPKASRLMETPSAAPLFQSRLFGGRARAGTLPSSWNNNPVSGEKTLQDDEVRARSGSNASRLHGFSPIGEGGDAIGSRSPSSHTLGNRRGGPIGSGSGNGPDAGVGEYGATAFLPSPAHRNTVGAASSVRPMTLLRQLSSASDLGSSQAGAPKPQPSSNYNGLAPNLIGSLSSSGGIGGANATNTSSSSPSSYDFHVNAPLHQSGLGGLRSRSGSNATTASGLGSNAFGPSIFTSTWSDRPLGQTSSVTDSSASRRSSVLASASAASSIGPEGGKQLSFGGGYDGAGVNQGNAYGDEEGAVAAHHTIDYLGLEHDEQLTMNQSNRPLNDARLGAGLQPQRNRASTLAAVPHNVLSRVRSNQDVYSSSSLAGSPSNTLNTSDVERASLQDLYNAYPVNQTLNSALTSGSSLAGSLSAAQGRNRAGTVAGLGGPGGRQRVERELLRMATAGNLSNLSGPEMSSLLASLDQMGLVGGDGIDRDSTAKLFNGAPLENFPYLDVSTPPPLSTRQSPFNTMPSTPTTRSIHQHSSSGTPDDTVYFSNVLNNSLSQQGNLTRNQASSASGQHLPSSTSGSSLTTREQQGGNASTSSVNQTPSRSLWIGNLHSGVTGQELMHVFAPYGAIESLRLLPEKECGFVNFVELADAVQAREDVLGRLGARLDKLGTGPGGTVRIGFGKVDSVPGGATGANVAGSRANVGQDGTSSNVRFDESRGEHGSSGAAGGTMAGNVNPATSATTPVSAGSGVNASDGNAPTRALWVGSIPGNVTSATLLSVFQPFGPVESARVLTHKNCGFVNFERVDDAVRARKMLNGREVLGSEVGAMRIGFAKVPTRNIEPYPANGADVDQAVEALGSLQGAKAAAAAPDEQLFADHANGGGLENYRSNLAVHLLNGQQERASSQSQGDKSLAQQQHPTLQQQQQQQPVPHSPQQGHPSSQRSAVASSALRGSGISSSSSIVPASDKGGVPLPAHMIPQASVTDVQLLIRELSRGDADVEADVESVSEARPLQTYYITIPLVSEVSSGRRFETVKLREIRRGIEVGQYTTAQCDQLALEYVDHIVDLASDYIGNTLVQKFFETCSQERKMDMLRRLAPHLAMVGCHKNGTWAAQKILTCADTTEQVKLIGQNLRPYVPGLLLDSFGNYVVQCCLPWTGYNDFVFDAMVDRCWEIAQGRFGARSMRACLEDNHVSKQQRKRVAVAIILNSVPLATSPNGSILLTWLLETSGLNQSYRLLAPRFAPHLAHLCTHKLASSCVLRLVTQKVEPEASRMILSALFETDDHEHTLEEIVVDQVHGSQFMTKVLASPTLTVEERERYAEQVKRLLSKHQLVGVPAYRRLCEDLGMVSRTGEGEQASRQVPFQGLAASTAGVPTTMQAPLMGHQPMGMAHASTNVTNAAASIPGLMPSAFMNTTMQQQTPSYVQHDRTMVHAQTQGRPPLSSQLRSAQQQQQAPQPDVFNPFWNANGDHNTNTRTFGTGGSGQSHVRKTSLHRRPG